MNGSCWPARLRLFLCINKADAGDNQAMLWGSTSQRCCGFPGQLQPPRNNSSIEVQGLKRLVSATKQLPREDKAVVGCESSPKPPQQPTHGSLKASNQALTARYTNLARGRNSCQLRGRSRASQKLLCQAQPPREKRELISVYNSWEDPAVLGLGNRATVKTCFGNLNWELRPGLNLRFETSS